MAMKDAADNVTAELIPMPKKRGRPATGKAMTAAERKAAQRATLPGYSMEVSMTQCSDTALNTAMQRALSQGDVVIGEMLAGEFLRRISERASDYCSR